MIRTGPLTRIEAMKRSYRRRLARRGVGSGCERAGVGWRRSFGGASVSDQDAADSAHEEMKRSISRCVEEPMSATDLDSRIAGVLSRSKALPDDVAALLAEVEAAVTEGRRRAVACTH